MYSNIMYYKDGKLKIDSCQQNRQHVFEYFHVKGADGYNP